MRKKFSFKSKKTVIIFAAVFLGIVLTVVTGKVLDYTDSPEFCSSCHIMTQVHESFLDSNHAHLSCSDCHLPHDNIVNKYVNKAKSGIGHVYYNTLGVDKIPKVLHTTENSKNIIQENCVDCHQNTIKNLNLDPEQSCVSCHQDVPHGHDFKTEDYYKPAIPGELLKNKGGNYDNG